jgi:ABC-type transport system involved in cytochrome c biogenesis permease component
MLPISPQAVFVGKALYSFFLMAIIEIIIVPSSMILFNYSFNSDPLLVMAVFTLGTLNLAVIGAMVSG